MSPSGFLSLLLALSASASEPETGVLRGVSLSLGPGRAVTARITFARRGAAAAGKILVLDSTGPGDEDAIRLAEAVIVRRGGLSSRAGQAARRHGVPAVSLGQGRWDPAGPSLVVSLPAYGPPASAAGYSFRPVTGESERVLKEGDAVAVDASTGKVVLLTPDEAESRVAAAEAARAYDGLRDAAALEHWLLASPDLRRASALLDELAPRAASGAMSSADLARVRRAAEAALPESARAEFRGAAGRAAARAERAEKRRAAERAGDGEAARAARAPDLDAAARAAGADRPEGWELPAGSWSRFVASNGLGEWLARTAEDSSLGLRLKSQRMRERILAGRLDLGSEAGLAALAAGAGPVLVAGEDAAAPAGGAAAILEAVKEVWAASWAPGPLGARLRAGAPLAYQGRVRVEKIAKGGVSGLAFSRDPGSGRRERVLVEAAPGPIERVLEGGDDLQSYSLERASGREMSAPLGGGAARALTAAQLARVAKLARALDAWKGTGVEIAFSFDGSRLLVHHARALEPPRPITPLSDPFAPRPTADALPIRPVR